MNETSSPALSFSSIIGSEKDSKLPLLEDKFTKGETRIYVCIEKACQLPVTEAAEAFKQIK